MTSPLVSIIICTRNRASSLQQTLEAIGRIAAPPETPCELIVIDNHSTDGTAVLVQNQTLPQMPLRYLCEPQPGVAHAKNTGMAAAQGEIILFTDDDVRPPLHWIAGMCAPILSGQAEAVAGGVLIPAQLERPWFGPFHRMMLASTEVLRDPHVSTLVGANMAFSKSVLAHVPRFDVELGPGTECYGEEPLFAAQLLQAGFRIAKALDDALEHHFDPARLSRQSFITRMRKEGQGQAYIAHHWRHERPAHFGKLAAKFLLCSWYLQRQSRAVPADEITMPEMSWVHDAALFRQYLVERKRPRNYEKLGLVKRTAP